VIGRLGGVRTFQKYGTQSLYVSNITSASMLTSSFILGVAGAASLELFLVGAVFAEAEAVGVASS
jgi:hypothetical protein